MVAAGAMYMTVLEFLRGCRANLDHLDVEVQGLIGERMIAVQRHHVADHRRYGK